MDKTIFKWKFDDEDAFFFTSLENRKRVYVVSS